MGRKKSPRRNQQRNRSKRAKGYNGQQHQTQQRAGQQRNPLNEGLIAAGVAKAQNQPRQRKRRRWYSTARPEEVHAIAVEVFGGQYYCVGTGNEQGAPLWEQTQAV